MLIESNNNSAVSLTSYAASASAFAALAALESSTTMALIIAMMTFSKRPLMHMQLPDTLPYSQKKGSCLIL